MSAHLHSINSIRYWLMENLKVWLPFAIVPAVLLLSAGLAFAAPRIILMGIPLLLAGVGVVLFFLNQPQPAFVVLIGTILVSANGPSGSNVTMLMVAFLMGLWLFDMIMRKRSLKLIDSITIKPLLALVLVSVLAFAFGQLPWFTFIQPASLGSQLGGLSLFILSAGIYLVMVHQLRDLRYLQWMVWLFLAIGAFFFITVWLVPQLRLRNFSLNYFFPYSTIGSQFWTWLIALAFSQAVFNKDLHIGWRLALGAFVLEMLYVGLFEMRDWNSGWVPALAAIVGTVWAAKPSLGLLLSAFGGIAALTKLQNLIGFVMIGDNEYSLSTRLEAWFILLKMAKTNPLLGFGPANYNSYTRLFPIRGWAVSFNSHSQYIDLIAQTGLLGLICFLWFFISIGWEGWQLRKRVPEGFAQAYVYGALGGLLATLSAAALGDWVIPFFFNIGLAGFKASVLGWIFLGGLIAIGQIVRQDSNQSDTDSLPN